MYYQVFVVTVDGNQVSGEQYEGRVASKQSAADLFLSTVDAVRCGIEEVPPIPGLSDPLQSVAD